MSSSGKWREEQILVICPGSRTTMAQLGCNELTPPTRRFPTRMFRDGNEWRPYHTYQRKRIVDGVETEEWVEDWDSEEGAVSPLVGGRIVNMEAFLAFLDHVHSMLTTTYHNTPIMLMASPQWTRPDCEAIAQYIFEKTRTPALCLIHSAVATQYGLKNSNMTVVDIGYEKVDVTTIYDGRVVNHLDIGAPGPGRQISGGEVFSRRLLELLKSKGFSKDMAEQLKRSAICEVLPYSASDDGLFEMPVENTQGASATAETAPDAVVAAEDAAASAAALAPKPAEANGDNVEGLENEDGVLDVASIVASGQTKEFLAKVKEKGKPGRKPKEPETAAQKAARLPNAKRSHNHFMFEEVVQEEAPREPKVPKFQEPISAPPTAENPAPVSEAMEAVTLAEKKDGETAAIEANPAEASAETGETKPEEEKKDSETAATEPNAAEAIPAEVNPAEANPAEASVGTGETKPEEEKKDGESEIKPEVAPSEPLKETAPEPKPEGKSKPAEAQPSTTEVETDDPSKPADTPEYRPKRVRRDIEVGLERFTFADRAEIDRIVSTIYKTIQGVEDMYMRPSCWENLVFVGNGARLHGLKENILQTLTSRHLVSPSTATMFTSELPSNIATPTGTGSQTPTGSFNGAPHQLSTSGVNPLLQAATTANQLGVAAGVTAIGTPAAGSESGGPTHHFHSQTPTNIKLVTLPTYLQEWTRNGFEEAMFLGAQVAARIVFCVHTNLDAQSVESQRLASLSRVDYNELGPKGIRNHSMLG